jgi:hypothetical protein
VGVGDGFGVGVAVGFAVGVAVGFGVGLPPPALGVGTGVGVFVGAAVGVAVGAAVGAFVGAVVGATVGVAVGDGVGSLPVAIADGVGAGVGMNGGCDGMGTGAPAPLLQFVVMPMGVVSRLASGSVTPGADVSEDGSSDAVITVLSWGVQCNSEERSGERKNASERDSVCVPNAAAPGSRPEKLALTSAETTGASVSMRNCRE